MYLCITALRADARTCRGQGRSPGYNGTVRHASWSVVACKSACRGELTPRAAARQDSTLGGCAADAERCRLDQLRPTSAVTAFRCSSRWRSPHATIDSLDDAASIRLYELPRRVVGLAASGRISRRRIVIGMASAPRIASSLTTLPSRTNSLAGRRRCSRARRRVTGRHPQ